MSFARALEKAGRAKEIGCLVDTMCPLVKALPTFLIWNYTSLVLEEPVTPNRDLLKQLRDVKICLKLNRPKHVS
jgi:hypothetical protein